MNKQSFSAVIVDDEKDARNIMESILQDYSEIKVIGTASDGKEGLYLINRLQPDVAFLDIDMPQKDGIHVMRELKELHNQTKIILTTAFEEYAIESIKYHPFNYLLKPIDPEKLKDCIIHLESEIHSNNYHHPQPSGNQKKKLKIKSKKGITLVELNQIYYCKAEGNYTEIYLTDQTSINATLQIGMIEEHLPNRDFTRINRSEIINLGFIKELRRKDRAIIVSVDGQNYSFCVANKKFREIEQKL
mgnify:FL=1